MTASDFIVLVVMMSILGLVMVVLLLKSGGLEQRLRRQAHIFLADHGAVLGEHQVMGNRVICLSSDGKRVFFIRKVNRGYETHQILLSLFGRVTLSGIEDSDGGIAKQGVWLAFIPVRPGRPGEELCFYDPKRDVKTQQESARANDWKERIKEQMLKVNT